MITFDNLYEVVMQVLPSDLKKLIKPEMHRLCFTWALDLQYTLGTSQKQLEAD